MWDHLTRSKVWRKMTRQYFGTDGIRGRANEFPMTADMAMKVAMASALALREKSPGDHQNRVVIGKDTRLSGYMFEQAMTAGFVAMGLEVVLLGPIPTPAVAALTRSLRADMGVMISASHNPFEDNGIKLFGRDGFKLDDALEGEIENWLGKELDSYLASPATMGKASRLDDAPGRYVEFVKSTFPRRQNLEGLKIVIDCANGAAYKVAPKVLWELEAEVVAIGNHPNGKNINADCGATDPSTLSREVLANQADLGIALDGDADRVILVDEKGEVVDGDQILAMLALNLKKREMLPGDQIVATVMSNLGLEHFLQDHDIRLHRTKVGDRYVVEKMREEGAALGGEQSGHIILSEFGSTGDGLMAALQVLGILSQDKNPASQALRMFDRSPQVLENVEYINGTNPLEDRNVMTAIKQAENELEGKGRLLVRASGTQNIIRVMAEGKDIKTLEKLVSDLCAVISTAACQRDKQVQA